MRLNDIFFSKKNKLNTLDYNSLRTSSRRNLDRIHRFGNSDLGIARKFTKALLIVFLRSVAETGSTFELSNRKSTY